MTHQPPDDSDREYQDAPLLSKGSVNQYQSIRKGKEYHGETLPYRKAPSSNFLVSCCDCCSKCCIVYAGCGVIMLLLFMVLIYAENITFQQQFREKIHDKHENDKDPDWGNLYKTYTDEKAMSCGIGALVYFVIWLMSAARIYVVSRKKRQY